MRTLAIDVGGTKFTLAAFEEQRPVLIETRATDRTGGPAWMFGQIEEIVECWRHKQGFRPERCGIGFGGPVDFARQAVLLSTHVEGWVEYPLVEKIRSLIGVSVVMDNDANVGALGEALFGSGQGADPLFYMTLSRSEE